MLIMITWSLLDTVITWPITNLFMTFSLRKRSLTCYKVDTRMDHIQPSSLYSRWRLVVDRDAWLRFGNKLNEEVCRGFIFANLFNSLYILMRLWWNILVANLTTNFLGFGRVQFVRYAHSWAIEMKTRGEIPHQHAPIVFSIYIHSRTWTALEILLLKFTFHQS